MGTRVALASARALFPLAVVSVAAQFMVAPATAVTPGNNGALLLTGPQGTTFSGAAPAPVAHAAECDVGPTRELWTVGPSGAGVALVGEGNSGEFSPDGRMLITGYRPDCDYGNALSLSRVPFHTERPIPGGDSIGGSAESTFGPWVGPENPTFLDPNGTFRDGVTGRALVRGSSPAAAMSCAGAVATTGGRIGTPIRVSGRARVAWRQIPGTGWLGNPATTGIQWSPDGQYVYFTTWSPNADRLWSVDANGRGRRLLFTAPASGDLLSQLSPDGKWILVQTIGGPSIEQLSVMTASGLGSHTVIFPPFAGQVNGGAVWSPRGDLLLVVGHVQTVPLPGKSAQFDYVVRPAGGPPRNLSLPGLELSGTGPTAVWSPDERFIGYATGGWPTAPASVMISPVAGGQARTILNASVPVPSSVYAFEVTDWQAAPGSGHQPRCTAGKAPF